MYESVFESAALDTIVEAVNYRRTSRRSSLLFFSQAVYVEEIARSCWHTCELVSRLSDSMCEILRSTENVQPKDTEISTVTHPSFPSHPNVEQPFRHAIQHLQAEARKSSFG